MEVYSIVGRNTYYTSFFLGGFASLPVTRPKIVILSDLWRILTVIYGYKWEWLWGIISNPTYYYTSLPTHFPTYTNYTLYGSLAILRLSKPLSI